MPRYPLKDRTDQVFGRLTVIERYHNDVNDKPGVHWHCKCSCGNYTIVRSDNLRKGVTLSCGCLRKEYLDKNRGKTTSHGKSSTSIYRRWTRIKQGCVNPYHRNYRYYGAKGIKLCERWQTFENFLADVGEVPKGVSLRRRDKKGDWAPCNVIIGQATTKEKEPVHIPRAYGMSEIEEQ